MAQDFLKQATKDVDLPDPSTGDDSSLDAPVSDDPGTGAGDLPADDKKQTGRGVDEVRGELLRKMDRNQSDIAERLARLEGMLEKRQQPDVPTPSDSITIENATSAQLEALRPQIPADKRDAFEQLVRQRREEERVDARFAANWDRRHTEQQRKDSVRVAHERYPELRNESSRLYKMTNKVLDEYGDRRVNSDPGIVLAAANEAAARLGIVATVTTRRSLGTAPGGTGNPRSDDAPQETLSKAKANELAAKLANALPKGKKFSIPEIQKSHAEYNRHRNLIIKP